MPRNKLLFSFSWTPVTAYFGSIWRQVNCSAQISRWDSTAKHPPQQHKCLFVSIRSDSISKTMMRSLWLIFFKFSKFIFKIKNRFYRKGIHNKPSAFYFILGNWNSFYCMVILRLHSYSKKNELCLPDDYSGSNIFHIKPGSKNLPGKWSFSNNGLGDGAYYRFKESWADDL